MIFGVTGRGEAGPRRRGRSGFVLAAVSRVGLLSLALAGGAASPARAADAVEGPQAVNGGVPCSIGQPFWVPSKETAETLPWSAVYLGHFSGGRPYRDPEGRTLIDWRDEYVCFPTSGQCRAWVHDSYRTHHAPEGYRACLLLR